jgi:hypothetical protein
MATLTIPDKLFERLQAAAANQQRPVDELLSEAIELVDPSGDLVMSGQTSKDQEMQRLRSRLGRTLVTFNAHSFLTRLGIEPMTEDDLDRATQGMPTIGKSLSETVVQLRNEERY